MRTARRAAAWHTARTAEHVWTDVGGAPPLVLQQVPLAHEMLPEAEVGDGYPMRPGSGRQRENTPWCLPPRVHLLSREQGITLTRFLLPWPCCLPCGYVGGARGAGQSLLAATC